MIDATRKRRLKFFEVIALASLFIFPSSATTQVSVATSTKRNDLNISYPNPRYPLNPIARKQIERGEYLSRAGDCIACHTDTDHKGRPFAGGLGIYTPFGSVYSPNITPDKTTGIGKWSDEDFVRAIHRGIAPDGSYYFPVFPFPNFTKITRDDVLAIKAYLFSLPPIYQENKPNEMMWPFNWRFLQLGWRILFLRTGIYQPNPQQTRTWNRGAYLVQGLGHCGMCHSPLNLLGAEEKKHYLTGRFIEGYYAPNITASGLKNIPIADIQAVFKQGKLLNGRGQVGGSMAEVNSNSLVYLTNHDLAAIAVYLKSVHSQIPKSAFAGPVTAQTGEKVYNTYCAICHTTGAGGAPKLGDIKAWEERLKQGKNLVYQRAIQGFNSMPPKGSCTGCSDDAVKTAVDYILTHNQDKNTNTTIPVQQKSIDLKTGKKIYLQHCVVCHNTGKLGAPRLGNKVGWKPLIRKGIDVLFVHTIQGYKKMPAKGDCNTCSNAEIEASVKYMVEESKTEGNYSLW